VKQNNYVRGWVRARKSKIGREGEGKYEGGRYRRYQRYRANFVPSTPNPDCWPRWTRALSTRLRKSEKECDVKNKKKRKEKGGRERVRRRRLE